MRLYWDIEATNLLNSDSVDYTQSPYRLKDDFAVHCAVFIDVDTMVEHEFVGHDQLLTVKQFLIDNCSELIAQNSISYDHMVMMAKYDIDFEVGVEAGEEGQSYSLRKDRVCGIPVTITDTLVMSKTLNPDRPAHSIDYFGKILGLEKIDWRAKAIELGLIAEGAEKGAEFRKYHPEMLVYCKRDCHVGIKVWKYLLNEWGTWKWDDAYQLEKAVAEIITRQEHRGFWFDTDKAVELVKDLDEKMETLRAIVEPLIPPKPIGKTAAKEFVPPKNQFKKDGSLSANIIKWVEKHGGVIEELIPGEFAATLFDKQYRLPIPLEPVVTHVPATIKDTTFIKGWLVGLGWVASQYKERDLTVDSKKHKLSREKYVEACDRYVEQTLGSPFMKDRMEHLEVYSEAYLRKKLLDHDHMKRPLKVLTNPTLTVGMEKDVDPNLLAMSGTFAYAKEISEYLTYSHRRNSILGGNVDPDDAEEDAEKGYMGVDRIHQDHRIQTPADTCGAGTSRFKHRICANIPRVTSLYGTQMRSLFGCDVKDGFVQLGYDYNSLEALCEADMVYKYEGGIEYGKSLTAMKPNDVHSKLAASISELLGRPFPRGTAKNVKYGCTYNAQAKRVAKTVGCDIATGTIIFDAFWNAAAPLKAVKERMQTYWETTGQKKFLLGVDGRKLPIRSKGNVINTRLQSTGVICAKRGMVIHDRLMKAEGMSVNFWKEDWKNKNFVQQLIAYHDEAQLELRKSDVKWKVFESEDEAKAFKDEHPTWSEVGHSEKGYYVGYCRAGELAQQAVKMSGEYYNLNVELSAGYNLGRNWAETH